MNPPIHMTAAAWETIRREAAVEMGGRETGGILLGHDFGEVIQVAIAGGPGPNARRSRDRFLRDRDHAANLAAMAWETDRARWIGEWHTHPAAPPVPSRIDLASYARHLQDPELEFDRFVSVVVGLEDRSQLLVAGWVVTLCGVTRVQLSLGDPQ